MIFTRAARWLVDSISSVRAHGSLQVNINQADLTDIRQKSAQLHKLKVHHLLLKYQTVFLVRMNNPEISLFSLSHFQKYNKIYKSSLILRLQCKPDVEYIWQNYFCFEKIF